MSKKSVSELHKLKPSEKKLALKDAQKFASEKIKEIFNECILSNITDDIKRKLLDRRKLFYNNEGGFSYYADTESIVIMMDIILQSRNISKPIKHYTSGMWAGNPTDYIYWNKLDPAFFDIHSLIKYCISIISDEYYIENHKIYPKRNQKIISAIKKLNNDDLNEILQDASANMDYKTALWRLRKFFEKDFEKGISRQKILESKLDSKIRFNEDKGIKDGEKCIDVRNIHKMAKSFFNFINSFEKDVTHSPKINGQEATQLELEIFFDFGLSLARIVLEWEKNMA